LLRGRNFKFEVQARQLPTSGFERLAWSLRFSAGSPSPYRSPGYRPIIDGEDQIMANGHTGCGWWIAATTAVLLGFQGGVGAQNQSVNVTTAGQAIAVDRVGDFVRVRTPGQQVDVSSDWRKRVTVSREGGDRLLVELGAREADGSIRMALGGDVLFDTNSTTVRPAAGETLGKIAQVIRDRSRGDVYVIGHTDSVGADAYNQKLSEARAAAVIAWLSQREGIPTSIMLGRGMGEGHPVTHNTLPNGSDNPQGRAQNRRVEIFLATQDNADLRKTVEVTRVSAGGSEVVVSRGGDTQTVQAGGRTVEIQQGAGGQRVQVGDTVVEVPQGSTTTRAGGAPAPAGGASAGARRDLRPAQPVQCTGVRTVELDSVLIDTPGTAIDTTGSCRVVIRNSEIRSQGVAIAATGLSQIEIIDSVVIGRQNSLSATGAAQISARGTEFRGAVATIGLSKFDDRGGNRLP
jgi:outer membrane protein OmpA-like peptidoglycan-associated protein